MVVIRPQINGNLHQKKFIHFFLYTNLVSGFLFYKTLPHPDRGVFYSRRLDPLRLYTQNRGY